MGRRLSADVVYGFDLGDDETRSDDEHNALPDWFHDDELCWEEVYATALGWEEMDYPRGVTDESPEAQEWAANRRDLRNIIQHSRVMMDLYGYEYAGSMVVIRESVQKCDYGAVRLATVSAPALQMAQWDAELTRFCQLMKLPIPADGFGWLLAASYA